MKFNVKRVCTCVSLLIALGLNVSPVLAQHSQGNSALITQAANNNDAVIEQVNNRPLADPDDQHLARIDQTSSLNEATIRQALPGDNQPGFEAEILQNVGTGNIATIEQIDQGADSRAYIEQNGTDNVATLLQKTALNSEAQIVQVGQENWASVAQARGTHYARVQQDGTDNQITLTQQGTVAAGIQNPYATLSQDGTTNTITLEQTGSTRATIEQAGFQNTADVIQNPGSFDPALQSIVNVMQDGMMNKADIRQNSIGTAVVTQAGTNNKAVINQ